MGKFADILSRKFEDYPKKELSDFRENSVAWLIQRYIEERAKPGARPMLPSQRYTLQVVQRSDLGGIIARKLKVLDIIEHCRKRRVDGALPQTINQDVTYLRVVLKHAQEVWESDGINLDVIAKAKGQLVRQQLIGKSVPRDRRPKQEEIDLLLAYFDEQDKHPRTTTPMRRIVEFSLLTARRISETCRITWGDIDHERRTCWVRDLKNSKGKGVHAEFPLLGRAYELVMEQSRMTSEPGERIFPYNPKTCSARYTLAKKKLAKEHPELFKNLRMHDNRREAISRLFEQGFNVPEVAKVSLHLNPQVLLRTYTALKPEDLHRGPASKRESAR